MSVAVITLALRGRGLDEPAASLTGEVGIAVFRSAYERWTDDGSDRDFAALVRESIDQLRAVTAGV